MREPHILYEVSENIVLLTLNRPEVRNAFSAEMIRLWREYLEKAQEDAAARVIVITGKGNAGLGDVAPLFPILGR
jgi:enoyl-CoA hydratase/carnithine racemase